MNCIEWHGNFAVYHIFHRVGHVFVFPASLLCFGELSDTGLGILLDLKEADWNLLAEGRQVDWVGGDILRKSVILKTL